MALLQSKQVAARLPLPEATSASHPVMVIGEFVVPAGLALNDVIEMGGIPAFHFPSGPPTFVFDDVDSNGTPLISFDAGIISGTYGLKDNARTCGTQFLTADTLARIGGAVQGLGRLGMTLVPTTADRGVGLRVSAAAATLVVGARIRMYLPCSTDPGSLT
jgi:hypothetical protein